MMDAGLYASGIICIPKKVPAPTSSLIVPTAIKEIVNPNPIPIASNMEGSTGFLPAYASALPSMIQLTTIKGMNIPRAV